MWGAHIRTWEHGCQWGHSMPHANLFYLLGVLYGNRNTKSE